MKNLIAGFNIAPDIILLKQLLCVSRFHFITVQKFSEHSHLHIYYFIKQHGLTSSISLSSYVERLPFPKRGNLKGVSIFSPFYVSETC